jgi:hypothetical protein
MSINHAPDPDSHDSEEADRDRCEEYGDNIAAQHNAALFGITIVKLAYSWNEKGQQEGDARALPGCINFACNLARGILHAAPNAVIGIDY